MPSLKELLAKSKSNVKAVTPGASTPSTPDATVAPTSKIQEDQQALQKYQDSLKKKEDELAKRHYEFELEKVRTPFLSRVASKTDFEELTRDKFKMVGQKLLSRDDTDPADYLEKFLKDRPHLVAPTIKPGSGAEQPIQQEGSQKEQKVYTNDAEGHTARIGDVFPAFSKKVHDEGLNKRR